MLCNIYMKNKPMETELQQTGNGCGGAHATGDNYRHLIDLSPSPISIHIGGRFVYINPAGLRLLGANSLDEIAGRSVMDFVHPDYREAVADRMRLMLGGHQVPPLEEKLVRLDGQEVIVILSAINVTFKGNPAVQIAAQDITRQKMIENELRKSEERYKSLISKLPDYVFVQVNDRIVYVNEAMLKAGSYEPGEMLHKSVYDFIDSKYHQTVAEGLKRRFSGQPQTPIEIEIILKSGERRAVLTKGELITYEGQPAIVIVSVDITDRKIAEDQLRRNAEELKLNKELLEEKARQLSKSESELRKTNASKDKFFSIIAHDLKGPFNGLLGLSEFLANEIDSLSLEEISSFAGDINKSAGKLFNLLENLLDWSRMQTEGNLSNPSHIVLHKKVRDIMTLLRKNAETKSICISAHIDENITVYADQNMLHSILQNLVTNSIKFTNPGGEIVISAKDYSTIVEISVSDNGIGMDEIILNKLFKIDENISISGTNMEKGTGLGLILCKEFVEKNGGRIWVESKPGQGTMFTFTLPKSPAVSQP